MKRFLTILFTLSTLSVFAQRPNVLIGNDYESISGFGGVLLSFSSLDGELASYTGGGGAVLLDNSFYFGGYGLGLNDDRQINLNGVEYDVDFSHGGFMLGYNIKPTNVFHVTVGSKLGWGNLEYTEDELINRSRFSDNVFVLMPEVALEMNLTHWFKFNVGVGYQAVIGTDDDFYDEGDVNSPTVGVSFLFGWFY